MGCRSTHRNDSGTVVSKSRTGPTNSRAIIAPMAGASLTLRADPGAASEFLTVCVVGVVSRTRVLVSQPGEPNDD